MNNRTMGVIAAVAAAIVVVGWFATRSGRRPAVPGEQVMAPADVQAAALRTYVKPGDLDGCCLFDGGGRAGPVYVAGVPAMRHSATVPVVTPERGTGYGFDEETRAMLGGYTWGDVQHPALSK